jgi:LacI family transcriptional regulator
LTGKSGVSEKTRRMVLEAAEQMGYLYPEGRRPKKRDNSGSIALIASDYAFSLIGFFGEIYLSIEQETSKRNMNLLIQSVNQVMKDRLILPQCVQQQTVDGILILSHISTEYINAVISTGIPTVLIDHHDPDIEADCILTNNRFGAYSAVRHLLELGHREIGYVGNIHFSPSYYERLEGYRMALEEHGLEPDPQWIIKDAVEQGDYINGKLSQLKRMPTAWFSVNDGLGFLVHSNLQQLGYKIPDDVSVCSFDNGQLSRIAAPSITTIAINLKLFGRKAVEQLVWRMENKDEPFVEILLPTALIQRESTAGVCHGKNTT